MRDYRTLLVWKKSHQLALAIYQSTQEFPNEEKFGLVSQMRRSAVSIPSNIAEGCGRGSEADFRRFLQIATASTSELNYQVFLSQELGLLETKSGQLLQQQSSEVSKMLNALIKLLAVSS